MISSELSEPNEEICPSCGGPVAWRQPHAYPVWSTLVFGLSFIAFLVFNDQIRSHPIWLWAWTLFQISVGIVLMRKRMLAKKRVLRCIRCNAALR